MFQFPGCPPHSLWIQLWVSGHYPGRVSPFGYPRIDTCLQFPVAFRSLPRPSSAVGARASTLCSYSLDFFVALLLRPTYNFFHLSSASLPVSLPLCLRSMLGMVFSHYPLQLAYSESLSLCSCQGALPTPVGVPRACPPEKAVGRSRLELPTSRLSGECSNRLS